MLLFKVLFNMKSAFCLFFASRSPSIRCGYLGSLIQMSAIKWNISTFIEMFSIYLKLKEANFKDFTVKLTQLDPTKMFCLRRTMHIKRTESWYFFSLHVNVLKHGCIFEKSENASNWCSSVNIQRGGMTFLIPVRISSRS